MELKEILSRSILSGISDHSTAVLFSGGIDSSIVLNLVLDFNISPTLYALKMNDVVSDDYKSFLEVTSQLNLNNKTLSIEENQSLSIYKDILIEYGIPKRKRASILVMSLFAYLIDNIDEDVIYTGLGSDAYYGLGRNFAIQCSLKGEKIPSVNSLIEFRKKTYSHYLEQYNAIKIYAQTKNKIIIAPFMEKEVYDFFLNKSFEECNKPKVKSILTSLYPTYFNRFKARKPSNFHCGNSNFKKIKL